MITSEFRHGTRANEEATAGGSAVVFVFSLPARRGARPVVTATLRRVNGVASSRAPDFLSTCRVKTRDALANKFAGANTSPAGGVNASAIAHYSYGAGCALRYVIDGHATLFSSATGDRDDDDEEEEKRGSDNAAGDA